MAKQPHDLADKQICDKYSKGSLMGNWYEERLNKQREQPTSKIIRQVDPTFAFEHGSGVHDLDRLTRLREPSRNIITNGQRNVMMGTTQIDYITEMKQSIASKSFNDSRVHEQRSIVKFAGEKSLFTIRQPESVQINYHNRAKVLNSTNLPSLMAQSLTVRQPTMGDKLPEYISTYQGNYEQPTSSLEEIDHTHHRRSAPKQPQHDLMTSLPLGKGQWNFKPNVSTRGYFRHIRSEITNSPNLSHLRK